LSEILCDVADSFATLLATASFEIHAPLLTRVDENGG